MKLGLATDPSKPLNEYEPLSLGSSHEDGFNLSFYQIMACEKRFVAQDYGGAPAARHVSF